MKNWNVRQEDIDAYLKVCRDAVEDDKVFAVFKSLPEYRRILEHTPSKIGEEYLQRIKTDNPHLLKIQGIFEGDNIGNPEKNKFGNLECSATTLQYIGVLSNLINLFGYLNGKRIIEIGGGYGGQLQVIQSAFEVDGHTIIDLEEVTRLQFKYLENFNVKRAVYWNLSKAVLGQFYLCISNYALSEITEPLQTEYVRNILLNSKHGYITCNGPIHAMQEIKDKFPTFKISPDIEGERKENFIITW